LRLGAQLQHRAADWPAAPETGLRVDGFPVKLMVLGQVGQ
jgi:hypothetical protein